MKKAIRDITLVAFLFFLLIFGSCKPHKDYVTITDVRERYRDRIVKDSIFVSDSIFVDRYHKGDTVFIYKEKYKYIYKDLVKFDTLFVADTINVPYPVKGDPIKYVSGFQNFQIWVGRLCLLLLGLIVGYKLLIKKFL